MLRYVMFTLVLRGSGSIHAAIFCVSNSAELVTAPTTESTNGEVDEIRLKADDYLPPVETGNLSVSPLLVPPILDTTPLPGSPTIDAGLTRPGQLGDNPLIDEARIQGLLTATIKG